MVCQRIFQIGLVLILRVALSAGEQAQRIMTSTSSVCPESEPAAFSACSSDLATVTCEYGQLCCDGEDAECVPDRSCYCDGSAFICFDARVSLACPSVCPEKAPLMNEPCDIDSRYECNYGDAVVCESAGFSYDFEHSCGCDISIFLCHSNVCPLPCPVAQPDNGDICSAQFSGCEYGKLCCGDEADGTCIPDKTCYCGDEGSSTYCHDTAGTLPCPSVCPEIPPMSNDPCNIDSQYQCNYGDPIVCDDTGYSFENEKQCYCQDGAFYCNSNACPTPCPVEKPVELEACSAPFVNFSCDYGKLCCGDEKDGACVPEKTCYCDGSNIFCYDGGGFLPCPEVCPMEAPNTNDSCDIDSRYVCQYGNPFTCDDAGYTFYHEKECTCSNGTFYCISNACPVPCPLKPPIEGDDCAPFLEVSCKYGEFCCPHEGEGECVPEKTCYCDGSNSKVSCYEATAYCPSACPVTKPVDGSTCAISERLYCQYATGVCSRDDLETPDASCSCILGKFTCTSFCMGDAVESVNEGPDVQNNGAVALPEQQEVMPEVFVQESPSVSPSESPSESPSASPTSGAHQGKNGKKKVKTKKKSRKLGHHLNRGGGVSN